MEQTKIKRPPSVLVTQILLLIGASLSAWSVFLRLTVLGLTGVTSGAILILMLLQIGLCSLYVFTFREITRRRELGRWLGSLLLSGGLLLGVFLVMRIFLDDNPQHKHLSATAIAVFSVIGIIEFCLTCFLIYRLAFGSAANEFFAKPSSGE